MIAGSVLVKNKVQKNDIGFSVKLYPQELSHRNHLLGSPSSTFLGLELD